MEKDNLRWAAYEPPTADQLERQQRIRDRVERLSVRPLQDSGLLGFNEIRRIRAGSMSGAVFTVIMAVLAIGTYLYFRGGM